MQHDLLRPEKGHIALSNKAANSRSGVPADQLQSGQARDAIPLRRCANWIVIPKVIRRDGRMTCGDSHQGSPGTAGDDGDAQAAPPCAAARVLELRKANKTIAAAAIRAENENLR